MTTTIPGSTITLPGVTFDTVTAGSFAGGVLSGGSLTRTSAYTCVFVEQSGVIAPAVQMPTGCNVGDVFEIYCDLSDTSNGVAVFGPSGEDFGNSNPLNPPQVSIGATGPSSSQGIGVRLRKVTSTRWGVV